MYNWSAKQKTSYHANCRKSFGYPFGSLPSANFTSELNLDNHFVKHLKMTKFLNCSIIAFFTRNSFSFVCFFFFYKNCFLLYRKNPKLIVTSIWFRSLFDFSLCFCTKNDTLDRLCFLFLTILFKNISANIGGNL